MSKHIFHRSLVAWVVISMVAVFLAFSIQWTPKLFAQTELATVFGRITDQSGAVIPGAEVEIRNVEKNISVVRTTNDEGLYTIPSLRPGHYVISVRKPGFKTVSVTDLTLNVQDNVIRNFMLQVGSVTESVTVTADSFNISTSPSVNTVLDRTFVGNLPLNGRSFQSLLLLTPGVTVTVANGSDYGQFSVNGQRASTNYFTVDGVSANMGVGVSTNPATTTSLAGAYPGLSAFGGTNSLVSVDALEEYKIQTSTTTAEFGRQPGGQVSLVTRSGSNQFHGTLFEYLRNGALDATDWFTNANGLTKAILHQSNFGGTFSGPVVIPRLYDGHDRTFFFFSYEGQRLRVPDSGVNQVPSMRVRSAAAAALVPFLNAFPHPSGPELLDTTGAPIGWANYAYSVANPASLDAYSIRIDHVVSSKLTLFGRFNQSPSSFATYDPPVSPAVTLAVNASTRTLTLGATSAPTPRLSNEFRFNYSRQLGEQQWGGTTLGGAVPVNSALVNSELGGAGDVNFNYGGYNNGVYVGPTVINYQRQINVVDNVSLVKGSHQLKFGVDFRRLSPTYGSQSFDYVFFGTEAAVISATASSINIGTNESALLRYDNYSLYGQDTWKVTPRLTLDYGLRWELNPAPTEANGRMPPVALGISGTDVSHATLAPAGTPFYNTFYRGFAPRGGVAYQLNQASGRETVVRGGFGVYYDMGSSGAAYGYPLSASNSLYNVPFPLSAANAARPTVTVPTSLPTTAFVYSNEPDLKLPYTLQWNVAVEQSLGKQQLLSVSYVGSAARRLLATQILNYPVNGVSPNPNFSYIYRTWNRATSDYDSMQVQYKARLKSGLQALVNYTWAHAIDEVSTDVTTNTFSRGNANFDVRHNLSGALTYNLPTPNGAPVLKHIFGNWSLDGILHAQSGLPVAVFAGAVAVNGILVLTIPNYVLGQPLYLYGSQYPGGRAFNAAAFTRPAAGTQGNFGRNVMRGLPIWQADMALGRSFNLTERLKLQFKGEFFNIFNHPNFGTYGTNYRVPSTFGVPTTMLSSGLAPLSFIGLSTLYQMGGPRSVQLSLKVTF